MSERYYYSHADGSVSNIHFCELLPDWTPESGGAWVEGEPPKDATPWQELSAADALAKEYAKLPANVRGAFSPYMAGVKACLEVGDVEGALEAVKAAAVPPELEPVRQQLLTMLGA
jgi:hypothetical protein